MPPWVSTEPASSAKYKVIKERTGAATDRRLAAGLLSAAESCRVGNMSNRTLLLIILIIVLLGALPSWPYSSGWGYYPSGGLGLLLIILIILILMRRI